MKRLAIYFFFDKDGIAREYNYYFVKSLRDVASHVFIVVNGELTEQSRVRFHSISDTLLERKNIGFDVWAYKEALEEIGWDTLKAYDELILCNFTSYGPIYPFEEMFTQMEKRSCSFWGVTKHPEQSNYLLPNKQGWIHEHLMSHFIVIRRDMFTSDAFQRYWNNMRPIKTKVESTAYHETQFTKYFEELGYKSDAYVDLEKYKGRVNNATIFLPDELILKNRCPLVKRRAFFFPSYNNILDVSEGHHSAKLLPYIKKTGYNINMIWDDILETQNISDVINNLHLNYIINEEENKNNSKLIAFFITVRQIFQWDILKEHLSRLGTNCTVFILADNELTEIITDFSHCSDASLKFISINEDIYETINNAAICCYDYDYICCLDAANVNTKLLISREDFYNKLCENLFSSGIYVNNILSKFEDDERLGLVLPFPATAGIHFADIPIREKLRYDYVKRIVRQNLPDLKTDDKLLTRETAFICKREVFCNIVKAYQKLPTNTRKEFIAYLYPSIAQSTGYYTAYVQSEFQARINATNSLFSIRSIISDVYSHIHPLDWSLRGLRTAIAKHCSYGQTDKKAQEKLHFKDIRKLFLNYIKQKFKFERKKQNERKIAHAHLRYLEYAAGRVIVFVTSNVNFLPECYLECGINKFYAKRDLSSAQKMLLDYLQERGVIGAFFEIPCNRVINKKILLKKSKTESFYLSWVGPVCYNALDFRERHLTTRIASNCLFIEKKLHSFFRIIFDKSYSFKEKLLYIFLKVNWIHKYNLFSENMSAADNSFELFKFAYEKNKNCYFVARKEVKESIKDKLLAKHILVYNSFAHIWKMIFSCKWITSFSLRLEMMPSRKLLDIHYSCIPSKWYFVPHGITIGDKIAIMVHKYSWDNPHMTLCCCNREAQQFSSWFEFRNTVVSGAPRMDKWLHAELDSKLIVVFFTWRYALSGISEHDFRHTKYYLRIMEIMEMLASEYPDRSIQYVFHHEVVRNGFDHVIKHNIKAQNVEYIYFNTQEGPSTFNRVFKTAKYLITDFSSVGYDFAYKDNSITIHYVEPAFISGHYPIEDEFFKIQLGQAVFSINELKNALMLTKPTEDMRQRKASLYQWTQGSNCERAYNIIFKDRS